MTIWTIIMASVPLLPEINCDYMYRPVSSDHVSDLTDVSDT